MEKVVLKCVTTRPSTPGNHRGDHSMGSGYDLGDTTHFSSVPTTAPGRLKSEESGPKVWDKTSIHPRKPSRGPLCGVGTRLGMGVGVQHTFHPPRCPLRDGCKVKKVVPKCGGGGTHFSSAPVPAPGRLKSEKSGPKVWDDTSIHSGNPREEH